MKAQPGEAKPQFTLCPPSTQEEGEGGGCSRTLGNGGSLQLSRRHPWAAMEEAPAGVTDAGCCLATFPHCSEPFSSQVEGERFPPPPKVPASKVRKVTFGECD